MAEGEKSFEPLAVSKDDNEESGAVRCTIKVLSVFLVLVGHC
jgi:hypothetical protein